MPTLADTLSALLAQATIARLEADRAAARIARLYQDDDLLRGLPVPRFRLPSITIDLPVALTGLRPRSPPPTVVLPLESIRAWPRRMSEAITNALVAAGFPPRDDATLRRPLDRSAERWSATGVPVRFADLDAAVSSLVAAWPDSPAATEPPIPDARIPAVRSRLREAALDATLSLLVEVASPPAAGVLPLDVEVELRTAELRELAARAPLTTIRLHLTEQGAEVVEVETAGRLERRLTPE